MKGHNTHNGVTRSNGLAKDDNLWKTTSNQRLEKLFSNVWIPSPPCRQYTYTKNGWFQPLPKLEEIDKIKGGNNFKLLI
jgi:hypothetical protein